RLLVGGKDDRRGEQRDDLGRGAHAPLRPSATSPASAGEVGRGASGQRGRGLKSRESERPNRRCSTPAQAIMAPLSVQSFCGGAISRAPYLGATPSSRWRGDQIAGPPPPPPPRRHRATPHRLRPPATTA